MRGISWPAEDLFSSLEGLCSMESSAKIVASVMDEYVWSTDGIILTGEHGSTHRKICPITSLSTTNHTDNLPVRFLVFQVMCNGLNRFFFICFIVCTTRVSPVGIPRDIYRICFYINVFMYVYLHNCLFSLFITNSCTY